LSEVEKLRIFEGTSTPDLGAVVTPKLRGVTDRVDKVVVGVATVQPQSVEALKEPLINSFLFSLHVVRDTPTHVMGGRHP
jgi:hypothetical protein